MLAASRRLVPQAERVPLVSLDPVCCPAKQCLGINPMGWRFLMSEVPLWGLVHICEARTSHTPIIGVCVRVEPLEIRVCSGSEAGSYLRLIDGERGQHLAHPHDRCLRSGRGFRNVQRFRGGLVFKAHRLGYHSTLGSRVVKKKKKWHRSEEKSSRITRENPSTCRPPAQTRCQPPYQHDCLIRVPDCLIRVLDRLIRVSDCLIRVPDFFSWSEEKSRWITREKPSTCRPDREFFSAIGALMNIVRQPLTLLVRGRNNPLDPGAVRVLIRESPLYTGRR